MMKTKILGAVGIAAVGVLGLGLTNTGAWFTDQASTEVTAETGTVDISLNGSAATPFTVGNLMPGVESGPYTLKVYNSGSTVPVKYRITTDNVTSDQAAPSALMDVLKIRLDHGFCDGDYPGDVNPTFTTTKSVNNLNFKSTDDSIATAGLGLNQTHCFALYFTLPGSAGNDYQNTSGSFDIVVDATQLENPGFNE